jgi:hypothetical protein
MKKLTIFTLSLMTLLTCACGKSSDSSESQSAPAAEQQMVLQVSADADINKCAYSLDELYDSAAIVMKVRVSSVQAKLAENDAFNVYTEVVPEVLEVYKGEYSGEKIIIGGGKISVSEYAEKFDTDISDLSDNETENGLVEYIWLNNHIPSAGEELVFFGTTNPGYPDCFEPSFLNQGVFVCQGDSVRISSLNADENWCEPLAEDIMSRFGGSLSDGGLVFPASEMETFLQKPVNPTQQ